MCDMTNSKIIVSELLRYLQIADYGLREELVLKIAILTEKFATEYSWYVDIILQLISSAGDHVGEEVWFRVVQIVTNNEDLQEYTAKTVLNYLVSPQYNETMIKVGSYILGEFGHLIANMPGCSPIEQFNAVQSKFALCSPQTRALILSTYIKFVNLFPEIKGEILGVFDQYRHVLDSELQQRACEYLSIATMPTEDVLQTVCEEMPPFPERESTLLLKLNEKQGDTEDKRTWSIGGKEANMERVEQLRKISQRSNSSDSIKGISSGEIKPATQPTPVPKPTSALEDLLGLGDLSLNGSTNGNGHVTASDVLTPGYEPGYRALQYTTEGTLYENGLLQVNLKSEYHGHLGRVALFYHNRTAHELTHFAVTLESMEGLNIMTPNLPPTVLSPQSQLQQLFNIECNALLDDSPQITIVFATQQSGVQTIKLKLPIVLTNFMEPIVAMDGTSFFQRWKQIGGPPLEAQVIFGLQRPIDLAKVRHVIEGLRFALLEGVDTNPQNIVGAGVVHAGSAGKVGTLLRLEPNVEQQMFRLTLRTTSDVVSEKVREIVQNALTYS
ncbi:hypothetical protein BZG36_05576 [Bifiguratus adelaidae]|uniref:Clathrin adaptor alpha/beta/gamma-adaptin appendage Ig-like subdomain domain-containing protein n=1 Tax=Bifiguratus adelaidae TaxID=1938954 RepID=A0A261XT12_9FUNG|nr:hypothetical protein BZG36_05576 [Bifiguratus adelaidae]